MGGVYKSEKERNAANAKGLVVVAIFAVMLGFIGWQVFRGVQTGGAATPALDTVAACTARGVAYFKEVGSYPTLKTAPNAGRRAEDVARERCSRTTTAFP